MRGIRLSFAPILIYLVTNCAFGQRTTDVVYPTNGAISRGQIQSVGRTELKLESNGRTKTVSVNRIRRITFADEPAGLTRARQELADQQFENAKQELAGIDKSELTRQVLRQEVSYYSALTSAKLAESGAGNTRKAAKEMLAFVKSHSDSFRFYEAVRILGDLALKLGSYKNALKYYGQWQQAPWPEYRLDGVLLVAETLKQQGDFSEALDKYDEAAKTDLGNVEAQRAKTLAKLGKATCLAKTGQVADAVEIIERTIGENDPQDTELFGTAYNALGTCFVVEEKYMDALLSFLKVDLLFYQFPGHHAEALYNLSQLYAKVNRPDRATQARNTLHRRYGGSVWASKQP